MSFGGRVNTFVGSNHAQAPTYASAASQVIDSSSSVIYVTGSATITSLLTADGVVTPGHYVEFHGGASAAVVFTNTNDTTTSGQMDLGGSNITLGERDVLALRRESDGSWTRVFNTNN